jgi:hypothetical protein
VSPNAEGSQRRVELFVQNLDCENDAAKLRRGLEPNAGTVDLDIYAKAAKVIVSIDPTLTSVDAIQEQLERLEFPTRRQARITLAQLQHSVLRLLAHRDKESGDSAGA